MAAWYHGGCKLLISGNKLEHALAIQTRSSMLKFWQLPALHFSLHIHVFNLPYIVLAYLVASDEHEWFFLGNLVNLKCVIYVLCTITLIKY